MAQVPSGAIYIHKSGYTIVQHNPKDWEKMYEAAHGHSLDNGAPNLRINKGEFEIKSHAYTVNFLDASSKQQVIADKAIQTRNNYYIGNDPSKWATDCKIFLGITVKDIYPNVDVRYYSQSGQVKYDLIAKPGADISKIALKYDGIDKLELKGKELRIPTTV